jgi:Tfp pilus assembly protein PilF
MPEMPVLRTSLVPTRASLRALVAASFLALLPACSDGEPSGEVATDGPGEGAGGPAAGSDGARVAFTDVTAASGITFVPRNGATGEKLLPETMGGGVAVLDHDADGDPDLLFVGSSAWPWDETPGADTPSSLALYANDGGGRFDDVTEPAGLSTVLYGMGAAVGDVEGDGEPDVYVTAVGTNRLYRNDGGRFSDATAAAGVAGGEDDWSTAAGFLDVERDGDLDLLVGNYVRWNREDDLAGDRRLVGIPGRAYAPPMAFGGAHPLLFLNRGDGVFDEAGRDAGLHVLDPASGEPVSKALAFLFADVDADDDTDVFVSCDTTRNLLFLNDGSGRFDEQGTELGLAYDRFGKPTGAMGVDGGAFAADDRLGLFVGNFADESSSAYVSEGTPPFFVDETMGLGFGQATRPALTFGLLLADLDLDGARDLLQVNGHLEPAIDTAPGDQAYAQAPQLFLQERYGEGPSFSAVPDDQLGDLAQPLVGRGATCADLDGDGDLDLVLTQVAGSPRILRNDQGTGNHWLGVRLAGRAGSPLAMGAEVVLTAGGVAQRLSVDPTRSYLSQGDLTLTFGLGVHERVDGLSVTWPDGTREDVTPPDAVDRVITVVQAVAPAEVQRVLNLAKAQLETGRVGDALGTLGRAVQLAPESAPTWRNLARARLVANDAPAALEALDQADALTAGVTSATYLRAVALARLDRPAEAASLLEQVVRDDPNTAAARFQLAMAWQLQGRDDDASLQLREAVRLDPSHGAAFYQLAVASRRAGDNDGFRAANREFLRLRGLYGDAYSTPLSLEACVHTLAEAAGEAASTAARQPPAHDADVRFREASDELLGGARAAASLGVLSMDAAGRYTLVLARPDGDLELLAPDGTARSLGLELGDLSGLTDLAVGNYFDEAPETLQAGVVPPQRPDVVLTGPDGAWLLAQQEDGSFRDVTRRSGLDEPSGYRALWVDHEHDGDLDLALAGDDGLALWVNMGDGRFEPSEELPMVLGPVRDVAALDLDENGAVDLVLARGQDSTVRIDNRRAGRFVLPPDPPGPWPEAAAVLGDDLDGDGVPDVILVGPDGVRFVFDGVPGEVVPVTGLSVATAELIDVEGDGWLDLVLGGTADDGRGALTLLRNGGRGRWVDGTRTAGMDALDLPPVAELLAADLDGDGDSDLLVRGADDVLRAVANDGGDAGGLLKLRLLSLMSSSGGLGSRVEVRDGAFFASRNVQREWPVEIGLGGNRRLDSVLAVWPYGVVDARTDVDASGAPLDIVVLEKADTGSCPFLFVWDGSGHRFICDMIGGGATGLPLARGVDNVVYPHEIVTVGLLSDFPVVDGALDIRITSELREAAYYDEAALLVVDHPVGTEIHSNTRLRGPPWPANEVLALGSRVPLRSAVGSDGIDRTAAVSETDGVHAPAGAVLGPPLRGQCLPMTLTLDFGPLDPSAPLVLTLGGWIEYGTASSQIALSQRSDVTVMFPELEARDGAGDWHPLDVVVGLPAGKRKTITCELDGLLPEGADALRLSTSFELYWDRVALFERVPLAADAVREIAPETAELRWRGFSDLRVRQASGPKLPDYGVVAQTPPWRTSLEGWCTRYGDVLDLLAIEDGRMIVLNGGDEMLMRLPLDGLSPRPAGTVRSLLWRSVGYNKEADPNNSGGGDVWPLGVDTTYGRDADAEDAWRVEYNTRWVPEDRFHPHHVGTR